ncbi:UNVERIFIED_ORG: hypothetical protein M2348_003735 [Sphingomonas sp. R1F5B]
MFALMLAAYLPPPGLHYFGRIEYAGPGLVCGAAFSIQLDAGERAELIKRSFIDAETTFSIREGQFSIRETQYETAGGTIVRKFEHGALWRKRDSGRYVWHYRDNAPGSTDVYGPSIGARIERSPLSRVEFGSPKNGSVKGLKCLDGSGFDPKIS